MAKIVMYNPETDEIKCTTLEADNPRFKKSFTDKGFKSIAVLEGFNSSIRSFDNFCSVNHSDFVLKHKEKRD